jgi:hypothetical protein
MQNIYRENTIVEMDALGGEPLIGSGFETEQSEFDFEADSTPDEEDETR